jgi:serine/threonine protein kinase
MPRQASSNGTTDPYRGRKIGKYEILTRLSVGGMAELFLAFTSGPGGFRKFVALKQILPDVKTEEFVKMFLDEARITAAFSHPNIGQVFDLGLEDDELYLAMEFLPGQNLEQVMMAASYVRPLPIGFAARVARDVCLGLHYAHNFTAPSGRKVAVVHRDMAPRNVMITYDGVVKVIDFGIAKAKGRIARTRVGMVKGTSGYMSPEQVRGQELDGRSDLFTAGVLLHEMLVGQRLFDTTDEDAMMRQIANAEIAPPRANNPDVPEALDAVVMKALAKDPGRRFSTGREMAKALEVAMGPDMFDEEAVAELMQALFADKRLKTLALLDYASHDDERVSKVVAALQEEKTLDGSVTADELDDSRTSPALAMPAPKPAPPPEPVRPPPSRASSPSGRLANPPKARPFPAAPNKKNSEPPSRKIPVARPVAEDAPTQIGPAPGLPMGADTPDSDTTLETQPAPRESRRPAKMGVFTLGPAEPKAAASAPEPKPAEDDSENSELSSVSRVSRAWTSLQPPARRGLWIVLGIVILGLAVLFMPESLKSKIGSLVSSPSSAPLGPAGSAEPSSEAYEPPPPSEDAPAEASGQKASPASANPGEAPKPPRPRPPKAAAQPSDAPAPASPDGQAPNPPQEAAPEPSEPSEPSQGPAEVDPSIRPLEDSVPSTDGEEQ